MSIQALEQNVNIKDLVLDEPVRLNKTDIFNPEQDVSPVLLGYMARQLSNFVSPRAQTYQILETAGLTGFLSKEKKEQLGIDNDKVDDAAALLKATAQEQSWDNFALLGANFRVLFPKEPFPVNLTEGLFFSLLNFSSIDVDFNDPRVNNQKIIDFCQTVRDIYLLYPERIDGLALTDIAEKALRNYLTERFRFHDSSYPEQVNYFGASFVLMALKLFSDQPEQVSRDDLEKMKLLINLGDSDLRHTAELTFNLMILQAGEMKVDDQGIHFVHRSGDDFESKSEALPERRHF